MTAMKAARKTSRIPPLTRKNLHGVWCALILPWNDRDQVDLRRLAQEVRGYAGTGVHGVYTGGRTPIVLYLTRRSKRTIGPPCSARSCTSPASGTPPSTASSGSPAAAWWGSAASRRTAAAPSNTCGG